MEAVAQRHPSAERGAQHNGRSTLRLAESLLRLARCDLARRTAFLAIADVLNEDRERLAQLRVEAQARVLSLTVEVQAARDAEAASMQGRGR